ncbi:hypothetical protein KDW19_08475 [Burkholderia cenocepacia]|uniref:DUF6331 family protein n=1 Tax=Burkholderia cepacia complex TaxID=87882 RepID=UPI000F55BE3C|nr:MULTISPECIES: DUF6331 family protein [Burkholderia cepacia complex]ELW9447634.1 hypothetical protein [Burkholderia cenocepacia]MBN3566686.1 hypothetical protein [Burkholderia cenocepacia]MBR8110149.1 hypothetical protein [Burkholderia cenocepacia]MBR8482486.1 hypothetical protein [Burkholderia cenocepacia]MDN7467365.1 DUF6331 family protein [Burkholderia orbicola]
MNRNAHKNDIGIGQDRWIECGDLPVDLSDAIDVDPHLAAVMPLIDALETNCVAGCCGIDAFGLWSDEIAVALDTWDADALTRLVDDLLSIRHAIEALPSDIVVSKRINQYFRKTAMLELLAHLRTAIDAIRSTRAAPRA